jgi:hypothetical protein
MGPVIFARLTHADVRFVPTSGRGKVPGVTIRIFARQRDCLLLQRFSYTSAPALVNTFLAYPMSSSRIFALALCGLTLAATHVSAVTIFVADLTNANENPPVTPTFSNGNPRPASFGTATFTLNDAQTELSFVATIFNIDVTGAQTPDTNDNLTAAHIHAGLNFPPANNGVVWGFFGNPFNNTDNDGTVTPFGSGVGGTFTGTWDLTEGNNTTLAAQLPNIFAGRAYMNFHTVQFGGGEVRGTLMQAPDSGLTLALFGFACFGLLTLRRKLSHL